MLRVWRVGASPGARHLVGLRSHQLTRASWGVKRPVQTPPLKPSSAVSRVLVPTPYGIVMRPMCTAIKKPEPKKEQKKGKMGQLWQRVKKEARHIKVGFALLWADTRISAGLVMRVVRGNELSRRERKQLLRTVADLFRIVPFAMFIIIPGAELLLPVALYFFPNMLPSTFEDTHKKEEKARKQLKVKLEMAKFLQETVSEMSVGLRKAKRPAEDESLDDDEDLHIDPVTDFQSFMEKVRKGDAVGNDDILRHAKLFRDEFMLDSLSSEQLVSLCKYMGLSALGTDRYLRFLLRNKMEDLRDDDVEIREEGIDTMTREELRSACIDRGMPGYGIPEEGLKANLNKWLQLSLDQKVPTSLLFLSRAFLLKQQIPVEEAIQKTIASVSDTVLSEAATTAEEEAALRRRQREKAEKEAREAEMADLSLTPATSDAATASAAKEVEAAHEEQERAALLEKEAKEEAKKALALAEEEEDEELRERQERLALIRKEEALIEAERAKASADKAATEAQAKLQEALLASRPFVSKEELPSHSTVYGVDIEDIDKLETLQEVLAVTAKATAVAKERIELAEMRAVEAAERKKLAELDTELYEAEDEKAQKAVSQAAVVKKGKTAEEIAREILEREIAEKDREAAKEKAREWELQEQTAKKLEKTVAGMIEHMEGELEGLENMLGERMHLIDTDADGFISASELAVAVNAMKHPLKESTQRALFNQLDRDKDGRIHLEVLESFLREEVSKRKLVQSAEQARASLALAIDHSAHGREALVAALADSQAKPEDKKLE